MAHFPDVLDELSQLAADTEAGVPLVSCLARDLERSNLLEGRLDESHLVDIIVGEHHPVPDQDDAVMRFAESLPCRCRVIFHASLDDPLMEVVCSRDVVAMLRKLGMNEDEPIESRMVTNRLKAAQKKLAGRTFGDSNERSAADWLAENMPQ